MNAYDLINAVVESVHYLEKTDPPRWTGRLQIPGEDRPTDILIFNIDGEYRAVPALCPHEAYNLSECPVNDNNILVCPAHSRRIDLKSACLLIKENSNRFLIVENKARLPEIAANKTQSPGNDLCTKTAEELRKEIEALRLANQKQQRQIQVITQSMETMLKESEQQKNALKKKAQQQQGLRRFVDRIMAAISDLLFVIDIQGRILRLNAEVEHELAINEVELLGTCIDQLMHPSEIKKLSDSLPALPWEIHSVLLETIRLNGNYSGEHQLFASDPELRKSIFLLKGSLLHSEQGKLEGAVVTALNITDFKNQETRLRLNAKAFESSSQAIFITDANGSFVEVNNAFCEISGYSRSEILGQNPRILKSNVHDAQFYQELWRALLSQGVWKGEIWDRRKNGELCPMLLSINAANDETGQLTHYVAVSTDISQQKHTEQALKKLAYYDVLTGLPNRILFKENFEREIQLAKRNNTRLALLYLDLDHFKNINDSLGHWAGDSLLQIIATRIKKCCSRKIDIVSRLGGDEFTLVLPNLSRFAGVIAKRVIKAISAPIEIKEHTVYVNASIGIAIFPDHGNDFDTLTKHADTAMYESKAKGRGMFKYFEASMNQAVHQRLLLENALRLALEHQEFQLYFQPKADCMLSRITGGEALVRWQRPGFGMVPPDSFISIAEETGLIIPLGKWILKAACLQANEWSKLHDGFRIAINLSTRQLLADDFIASLDQILAETLTNPQWIELEITESLVMHDIAKATQRLQQIQGRGIHVAMDDFGTGYSSLSYLKKLPIQTLKIDRSFIQAYTGDTASSEAAFIRTIITMGQVLNLTLVAEGVETQTQLAFLQTLGCDQIQGYLLSPPITADEFKKRWLNSDFVELN